MIRFRHSRFPAGAFASSIGLIMRIIIIICSVLFTCIFDTDTDTLSQMYLRYRYKILYFNCIKDTDTTKKYL